MITEYWYQWILLLDLFDFIDLASSSHIEDNTYSKILRNWNDFMDYLPDEDKKLLLEIMNKCYFEYKKSINTYGISDFELFTAILMSILLDQQIQVNRLKHK
jgi:hypothetical protein